MTSSTVKDGWVGNSLWLKAELVFYMPEASVPPRSEFYDNMNRMLCPVSPVDFMGDSLDREFFHHYLET